MERGWMKIYRKISDHELWNKKPFSDGQAWVDLLLIANHKSSIIDKRGFRVKIERGQVGYSMKGLADRWGWSIGKVNRFLKYLENENQIETQKTNVTTLITLANFEKYNDTETKTKRRRNADETQTETNKNEKNEKKSYSDQGNVKLTESQFDKLSEKFGEEGTLEKIETLSEYISQHGKKYKCHYSTILAWARNDAKRGAQSTPRRYQSASDYIASMQND